MRQKLPYKEGWYSSSSLTGLYAVIQPKTSRGWWRLTRYNTLGPMDSKRLTPTLWATLSPMGKVALVGRKNK